jgi:hypothetical protein
LLIIQLSLFFPLIAPFRSFCRIAILSARSFFEFMTISYRHFSSSSRNSQHAKIHRDLKCNAQDAFVVSEGKLSDISKHYLIDNSEHLRDQRRAIKDWMTDAFSLFRIGFDISRTNCIHIMLKDFAGCETRGRIVRTAGCKCPAECFVVVRNEVSPCP